MKKYDSYKDSGIEWIGEIPSHWNISKLKFVCKIFNGDSLKDEEKELYSQKIENAIPYVSTKDIDVHTSKINYKNGLSIPVDHSKYKIAPKNSFLMCIEGGSAGRKYSHLEKDVFFVNKLACFETKTQNNKFLYYYSQSPLFQLQFQNSLSGLIGGVAISQIRNFSAIIPIPNEQIAIANYLDQKTTQIEHLIAKKEQFIKLLEEERVAVINQAVTKGLDPNVSMKDSGIEWLGEIPEHWESYRIDWVANIVRGNTGFRKDELLDSGEYVALQYGKTYKVDIVDNSFNFFVNSEFYKESQIVSKGDTILISTSETIEDLGHVCYYDNDNIGLLGGEQILLQPNRDVLYEKYLFQYARQFSLELKKYAKGLKVFRFNTSDLKQLFIAIPSIEEQVKIADFIEGEIIKIDALNHRVSKEIELLKEYKTALISEVVTGKVDVRKVKN
jgi:type I restriction enzyme S subunit